MFTLFDVKTIQIWAFPADPSTERVPSLAERVAYLGYSINLRFFNWRVPALVLSLLLPAAFNPLLPSQTLTGTEAFDISFNIQPEGQ